jgi:magnesium transporter
MSIDIETPITPLTSGESIEARLTRSFVEVKMYDTVGSVRKVLRQEGPEVADLIVVLDGTGEFLGIVEMGELIVASDQTQVEEIMRKEAPTMPLNGDLEAAASLAIECGVSSLPVLSDDGKAIGILTSRTLMDVLRIEHIEDIHHLAGVLHSSDQARSAMVGNPFVRARYRLPWLMVGLGGSMVATTIVANFEETLQTQIAIAFFLPAIIYLADAVGTQSEAIAVRGLSLMDVQIRNLIFGELITGLLVGLVLAVFTGAFALFVFGNKALALAILVSVVCASTIAAAIGIFLPWMFSKVGWDPAMASGPIATVIQDVISIAIYLSAVSLAVGV